MERNSSSFTNSNMKNQSIYRGTMKDSSSSSNKVLIRDSWRNTSSMGERSVSGEELFSWPPRSYSCSFCKREFRSAQALGGHMNVHRRDRARLLRQSPPRNGQFSIFNLNLNLNQNLNPNPNPNPKPKPNFSSSSSVLSPISSTSSILFRQPFTSNLPPFGSPPLTNLSSQKWGMTKEYHSVIDHLSINSADIPSNIKNTKTFFGVGKFDGVSCVAGKESDVIKKAEIVRLNLELGIISDSKSDLDLELRLGHS